MSAVGARPPARTGRLRGFVFRRATLERIGWSLVLWFLFTAFVLGPLLTVVVFSFTPSVFEGVGSFTSQWFVRLFTEPAFYGPLVRSVQIAIVVVSAQLVFGTFIAYSTVRRKIFGSSVLDALSNITIALPSVVVGLALLAFFGPFGPFAALTDLVFGDPFTLTFTFWIVVLAHLIETFPYMVRAVSAVLLKIDPHHESAARSLGGSPAYVFVTITLPQLKPGLVAGSVLVIARSIAEFGATIIVVSAVLRTAPIAIFGEVEAGALEMASAYSVVLMLVSFAAYVLMTRILLPRAMVVPE